MMCETSTKDVLKSCQSLTKPESMCPACEAEGEEREGCKEIRESLENQERTKRELRENYEKQRDEP